MPGSQLGTERTQGTGTWSLEGPIDYFMSATYRSPKTGRTVQMPVKVAGDKITVQYQGMAVPQS